MQSNFTNDDFEQFLKQSADSCRMRPSDKVWKGVSKHLNERKRRVRFATGIFLMAASLVGFYLVDSSKSIHRTTPSTTAEVNHTNASTSGQQPGTNKGAVAPSSASPKQRSAIIRTMPQVKSPITALAEQTTASNDFTAESHTTNFLEKEPARVVPLFKGFGQNSSLFADNSATAHLPVAINNDPSHTHEPAAAKAEESATEKEERQLLSIESVTNAYRPIRLKSRFTFQVYFTPTVSYRKLSENKAYLSAAQNAPGAVPNIASFYSVNNAVTHKPDIGLELGFAAKYPLAKNVKVRGGLQFNMNRYDIKAFTYTPEVATIALNTGNNQVDYLGSVTHYRNFSGNSSDWLQNLYFQASAPLGVEYNVPSKKPARFGVAGTLQPSYVIGDRAYLISSDYKNYTEIPWLTRRWNVATSLETYVSYSTGKMSWQVGPQVRYQLLSSFNTKYPVKENLFDFGFKVGVSVNKSVNK